MAKIVAGLATSHSPQLSTPPSTWHLHAERDRSTSLLDEDRRFRSYAELAPRIDAAELSAEVWQDKHRRAQEALARLSQVLADAEPDVVVIVGDDQDEFYAPSAIPAFGFYTGDEIWDLPPSAEDVARLPPGLPEAQWAQHAGWPDRYPIAVPLTEHVAAALTDADFDLCVSSEQPPDRGLGHAFTFIRLRLGLAARVPILPVFVNTYVAPNVPSAQRCHRFGQALGDAIRSWPGPQRVVVVASGGLSHFLVDERLDRDLLAALEAEDPRGFAGLTRQTMRSGSSEILNWVVAAGALSPWRMETVDYVPGYRTVAGTGVGMGFGIWRSEQPPVESAVDGDRGAGDETGDRRAQEGHQVPEVGR